MATYEIARIGAPRPPRKFLPNISSRQLQPRTPQELPHSLALLGFASVGMCRPSPPNRLCRNSSSRPSPPAADASRDPERI
jgi:hypothetical protein